MKGFIGSIINILFFPLTILRRVFGFLVKPMKFIQEQRKIEANYQKQRAKFFSQRKKLFRDNDEII